MKFHRLIIPFDRHIILLISAMCASNWERCKIKLGTVSSSIIMIR